MAKGVNWKVVFVSSLSVRVLPAGYGVILKIKGLNLFPDLFRAGTLMVGQADLREVRMIYVKMQSEMPKKLQCCYYG